MLTCRKYIAYGQLRRFSNLKVKPKCEDTLDMKVFNVAEKNDAAKNIAALLSKRTATSRKGISKYNPVYEFDYDAFGRNCRMVMTSVSGHLFNYEFEGPFRSWNKCTHISLFEAPVSKVCLNENIKKNLEKETRACSKLIIWTDCDREGENIGFEIISVCSLVKPNIQIHRAKFSEITKTAVERALVTLEEPNTKVNDAVNVRQELDLRIGAAFTRFQTVYLAHTFPDCLKDSVISYGSCQFPTLGFVVERFKAIASFIAEPFWKIDVTHTKDNIVADFKWKRHRLFNENACDVLFLKCQESGQAVVENVETKPKSKWRPKPLDTIALEKLGSKNLRLSAKEIMSTAEKLYSQGYISYPRTETTIFPKGLNLEPLVQNQVADPSWGAFAQQILDNGPNPFQGNKSDQAHPPIHPLKYAPGLQGNEKRIYEFVVRHFLACLSKHAEGLETIVDIDIAEEKFTAKGLMIISRNYLDVYPYERWNATELPIYEKGHTFAPDIQMKESVTNPPELLTEADLIDLMDKNGIGTDATHADHIEKIKARLYVGMKENRFLPRTLGMALVEGYDAMGLALSRPHLRAELEADLKRICDGEKTSQEVLQVQIRKYREVFEQVQQQVERLKQAVQTYLGVEPRAGGDVELRIEEQIPKVKKCPGCGKDMGLMTKNDKSGKYLGCFGYPTCKECLWFPKMVKEVTVLDNTCPTCGPDTHLLQFKFERGSCYLPPNYAGCIGGCDPNLLEILNISIRKAPPAAAAAAAAVAPADTRATFSNDSGFGTMSSRSAASSFRNASSSSDRKSGTSSTVKSDSSSGSNSGSNNNASSGSDGVVRCRCNVPAVVYVTKKAGPNEGKQFFSCPLRKCNFFQWATDEEIAATKRYQAQPDQNCYCALPPVRLLVSKPGPNTGRSFLVCKKDRNDPTRCNFFQWAEDEENQVNFSSSLPKGIDRNELLKALKDDEK